MLALLIIAVTSAWAQDEVTVAPTANANEWTLEMPDADVELEVTYYTDEEAPFIDGVELTANSDGTWSLAEMPGFDIELEVEYYTDEEVNQMTADEVIAKINAIGTVEYTDACKALIDAAREAYDALTDAQKALVSEETLKILTDAEEEYAQLAAITSLTLDETEDNSSTLTTYDGQKANVTLTRTLQTGGWNTFCVPFSVATPSGWTVKELTASSFDSGTEALSLTFGNATSIVAGTPYLVKVTSTIENPTFDGVTISKDAVTTETTAVDFVPTLGLTEISGDANDILFLSSGNTLLHPSSLPANMKGFRAYFLLKGDAALARSFSMDFGDGVTTGIITIENVQSATDKAIYDLQGRRVNGTAQKGMYIVNGKKTVIK